ncbi:hypothetical protein EG346_02165 [Chryseobacterium carnipullorum]|uniref:Uncharacterized protein n=1 Tax=Chryseobacterium carnipullorum TaxID=1124835 RepID=A0A376EH30_CHRCU|nr:hypothetical protein [Chryseobacterium carnipullorum]AZA47074.1 hypothetical protein EG346_02165 [Chryseobacterium carnipullorum]AZA66423.1 hypothetical protein EG345_18275 [Chryseobacterium carnipullorum]STD07694.1 Uncharacterised protein [Chryseobacterium carnipullorum]
MKKLLILPGLFFLFVSNSCHKEIKSEKGGIDVVSNVYFDASKNLNNIQSFHLSSLNYSGDSIIERIPDVDAPEITQQIYFIKDSLCYTIENENPGKIILSDITKNQKPILVENKKGGTLFSQEKIPNYRNRKNLSDTVLFKKKYKRFEINSPWMYTRFYIYPTDTILPYSIYKHVEKDYHGRLERIDSYNKKTDIFVTLQLISRKNWDSESKEIFEFNHFVKNRKK